MDIDITREVKASKEKLWEVLESPSELVNGVSDKVEIKDQTDNSFKFVIKFKIGIFTQKCTGDFNTLEKKVGEFISFDFKASFTLGKVAGEGRVELESIDQENTKVKLICKASSGGVLSSMLESKGGKNERIERLLDRVVDHLEKKAS